MNFGLRKFSLLQKLVFYKKKNVNTKKVADCNDTSATENNQSFLLNIVWRQVLPLETYHGVWHRIQAKSFVWKFTESISLSKNQD